MESFIKNLAKGAGAILREGFRKKMEVSYKKGIYDVVTQYDLASEQYITERIKNKYPSHRILSEESGDYQKSNFVWLIDPIDGTHSFVRGIPQFSVSIAFAKGSKLIYGAIYDPVHDEIFFAARKHGATLNNRRINVCTKEDIKYSVAGPLLCTGGSSIIQRKKIYNNLIFPNHIWPDRIGSMALTAAYTACGRYDFFLAKGCSPWDYAAGCLILAESGAKVSDFKGRPYHWSFTEVAAANRKIHKSLISLLKKV